MTSEQLLERLTTFASNNQKLTKKLPKTTYNIEYSSQLVRSSSSPGANYIEALEAASPKDFCYRLKVCRKETRESAYWLSLIQNANEDVSEIKNISRELIIEAKELIRIFTSSIFTSEKNQKIIK
jgi:four helix bundle protein